MEMQQVRYYVALAETLNFTKAAERCNVTQPVLTRAIQNLEAELGGDLIRREGRLSHLTELGQRMLPLLRQCYEGALAARAVAKALTDGETRTLALGLSRTVDLRLLQDDLSQLFQAMPAMRLRLRRGSSEELVALLKSGEIELAVAGPLGGRWDRLVEWPLFSEGFDVVLSQTHPLAHRNAPGLELEDLRMHKLLVQDGCELRDEAEGRLAACGISLAEAHAVDSGRDLEELVAANIGFALAPASSVRDSQFLRYALPEIALRRTVSIYSVAGRPRSPEAATLLNQVRARDWTRLAA